MVTVSHADAEHWQHSGGVLVTFNQFLCGLCLPGEVFDLVLCLRPAERVCRERTDIWRTCRCMGAMVLALQDLPCELGRLLP